MNHISIYALDFLHWKNHHLDQWLWLYSVVYHSPNHYVQWTISILKYGSPRASTSILLCSQKQEITICSSKCISHSWPALLFVIGFVDKWTAARPTWHRKELMPVCQWQTGISSYHPICSCELSQVPSPDWTRLASNCKNVFTVQPNYSSLPWFPRMRLIISVRVHQLA